MPSPLIYSFFFFNLNWITSNLCLSLPICAFQLPNLNFLWCLRITLGIVLPFCVALGRCITTQRWFWLIPKSWIILSLQISQFLVGGHFLFLFFFWNFSSKLVNQMHFHLLKIDELKNSSFFWVKLFLYWLVKLKWCTMIGYCLQFHDS